MGKHKKLSYEDRCNLSWWRYNGISIREIARRLNKSPSTICEEIKRNRVADGKYWPHDAHKIATVRSKKQHKKYLLKINPALNAFVHEKLTLGWPEFAVSGHIWAGLAGMGH